MKEHITNASVLGKAIRKARKAQHLTQEDLAGMAGTGRRFISDLENGKETSELGKTLSLLGTLGVGLYAITAWEIDD